MIKYITYCRKSLEDEGRQVMSIVVRQTEIKEFAKGENLDIIEWFTETKIAKKPGRVKFEEKMKVQETIIKLEAGGLSWIEPMRKFIRTATECEKIARAKNNGVDPDKICFPYLPYPL